MKSIFKYIAALGLGLSVVSCNFLEKPILGSESLDAYFANNTECNNYVIGTYNYITTHDWEPIFFWYVLCDMASDDGWMNSTYEPASYPTMQPIAHYQGGTQATTNGYLKGFWEFRYKGITECNVGLRGIKEAPIDQSLKDRYMAELKFLRSFFYFDLVKNFGGVPLVLKELDTKEALQMTRSTAEKVYAQIIKDLKDCENAFSYKVEAEAAYEAGRVNKGMVQALLAKVYLYTEQYDEAFKYAKLVIDNGGYSLQPDFRNVWTQDLVNPEEVFAVHTSGDMTYYVGNPLPIITGSRHDGGWGWGGVTSDLEKAFDDAGDAVRKQATITKNGEWTYGEPEEFRLKMLPDRSKSCRLIRKFYIPVAKRTDPYYLKDRLNYHIIRYADVLLIASEAAYHKSASDENAARKYLNMVRTRAELPECNATGKDLRDAIRAERRLEFAWECNRIYDLRRWKDDNGDPVIWSVFGPEGSFVKRNTNEATADPIEWANQVEPSTKGSTFTRGRDELFPIPDIEVVKSEGRLVQNPGF